MPLLLRCEELEPGLRVHEPIIQSGRVLLREGHHLTHADVDILRNKYPDVLVRVGDPILDDIAEFEDDTHDREVAATVQSRIAGAMSQVAERYSSRASLRNMDIQGLRQSVTEVMEYLRCNPVSAAVLSRSLDADNYLAAHSGNMFYLSMILGSAVRDYVNAERQRKTACRWLDLRISMNLLPLGLGAMFADVGMLPLAGLLGKKEPLSQEDWNAIADHPDAGADSLPEDFPPAARSVVRAHHENFDGSGYPAGVAGSRIHVFSRIVRIADAYDAATATHVYQEAMSAPRALWMMSKGRFQTCYDPVLMKFFSRMIQPFPIGAKIRLRDGRSAVVVRYNRENPFAPTVIVAFNSNGDRLPKSKLEPPARLSERPHLRAESYAGDSLGFLYGIPSADESTTQTCAGTSFEAAFP